MSARGDRHDNNQEGGMDGHTSTVAPRPRS